MPIDYKNYPANWKTEIRPRILQRAGNKCECCLVPNYEIILRGTWGEKQVYQIDDTGAIHDAETGRHITSAYVGDVWNGHPSEKPIKVVLTIAHLDHDTNNNEDSNLKAMCQRCHLLYDKHHHIKNSKETNRKKKRQIELFNQ